MATGYNVRVGDADREAIKHLLADQAASTEPDLQPPPLTAR